MTPALSDAELLARLVSFDSTSCYSNLPIADFICDYLDVSRIEIVRNYNTERDKVNVIARLGPKSSDSSSAEERTGLILSGHMDVVPAEEPEWESDPFTLRETADAFIGRGACDMKGFVALAVNSMRRAVDSTTRHPLVLILTYDEEPGTLGAMRLAETWDNPFLLPKSAIIGEPTMLRVVRMHKGHTKVRVTVRGRPAHSGYPHLGLNAIEPMGRIICALTELRKRWERARMECSAFFPETPFAALNVGTVHGGAAMNIVPDRCVMEFGFRALPGMDSVALLEEVRGVILADEDADRVTVEVLGDSPPLITPESARVHQSLWEIVGQPESIGASYATDAGPLSTMGLECVVWGPGSIEVAHKPNESMPKRQFEQAGQFLGRIVTEFCI